MVRLWQERFPPGTLKKLHARSAGPFKVIKKIGYNVYVLDLPSDLGISSTFNVSDLVEYKEPIMIPSEPFEPEPIIESESIPECPPTILPKWRDKIERIRDDQAITTRNKGYQRYLVRWQGRPESEDSWITREDLQRINLDLLEYYQSKADPYSTESSSFHLGGIGAGTKVKRRLQSNLINTNSLWIAN